MTASASQHLVAAPEVDPHIRNKFASVGRQRVIVHLAEREEAVRPSRSRASRVARRLRSLARRKQALLDDMAAAVDGRASLVYDYPPFAMLALSVEPAAVVWLTRRAGIRSIRADGKEKLDADTSIPFTQADLLHANNTLGAGTAVAVLDAAVAHWTGTFGDCPTEGNWQNDVAGCGLARWDNFNSFPNAPDDQPQNDPLVIANTIGHGSNVTGIVHAVAPAAKILGMNVAYFDTGSASYRIRRTDVLAALATLPSYITSHGLVAANLSFGATWPDGRPCNESDYFSAIRDLWNDHDLLVTASAGNGGFAQWLSSPGCETPILTVGAQHDGGELADYTGLCTLEAPSSGEVACFSNANGMLDFVAPGVRIEAADRQFSGTSQAAPHVAGAIALMQSRRLANNLPLAGADDMAATLRAMADTRQHNGQAYAQLDLSPPLDELGRATFDRYFREHPQALIPSDPHRVTFQAELDSGTPGGVYLHLELIHARPENVRVTLEAPSGSSVEITLPSGSENFNEVIGRHHLPGALDGLSGEPNAGTWTLSLTDSAVGQRGYYVSATLYALASTCVPNCGAGSCGSDGCGGTCGDCNAGAFCDAQPGGAVCTTCTPICTGVCGSDRCGGSCGLCDDQSFCNGSESCRGGVCIDGAVPCNEPDALPCTETCSESKRRCNAPMAGFCVIDDQCVAEGTASPSDPCQVCDPAQNDSAWSVGDGMPCDDGDGCTEGDACELGVCGGLPKDCPSANACQVGTCDVATGACASDALPDGSDCDDGDACTTTTCEAGSCAVVETTTCPAPRSCHELLDGCDPQTGACQEVPLADGAPCPGGSCRAGECVGTTPPATAGDDGCTCQLVGTPTSDTQGMWLLLGASLMACRRQERRRPLVMP